MMQGLDFSSRTIFPQGHDAGIRFWLKDDFSYNDMMQKLSSRSRLEWLGLDYILKSRVVYFENKI
jgi:hypothetical protein